MDDIKFKEGWRFISEGIDSNDEGLIVRGVGILQTGGIKLEDLRIGHDRHTVAEVIEMARKNRARFIGVPPKDEALTTPSHREGLVLKELSHGLKLRQVRTPGDAGTMPIPSRPLKPTGPKVNIKPHPPL